jgi:hypothetical protein
MSPDTKPRWWEYAATVLAIFFILAVVFGTLPGCGLIRGAYESRHNNDSAYWGSVSQQVGKR